MKHHVGELIRRKRKELGLTLQDLAGPELSVPTISNIERGVTRHISREKLDYLLSKMGLTQSELIKLEQETAEQEEHFVIKLDQVNALILNGCYSEAEQQIKVLEREEKKKGNPIHFCRLILLRGKNYMYQKKYDRAEWEFHNTIRRCEEMEIPSETNLVSETYGNLGYIAYYQNNFDAAIRYTSEALNTFNPDGEKPYMKGRQLHNLALYYERIGKANQAYGLTSEALAIADEHNDYSSLISIYILKATIQQNYYSVSHAVKTLKEAQKFLHLTNDPKLTGTLWHNLGEGYFHLENYDMAEQCFATSVAIREKHLDRVYLIRSYIFLGRIATKRGSYTKGKKFLRQATELAEKANNPKYLIESLLLLTHIFLATKERSDALETLKRAFHLAKTYSFTKELKEATILLAQFHEKQDKDQFLKYIGELYAIEKENFNEKI